MTKRYTENVRFGIALHSYFGCSSVQISQLAVLPWSGWWRHEETGLRDKKRYAENVRFGIVLHSYWTGVQWNQHCSAELGACVN